MAQLTRHMRTWNGALGKGLSAANLASAFTPNTPMYAPGTDPKVFRVKSDIPKALQDAIEDDLKPIGPDCLRTNTEACLEVYQDICLQHVLSKQVQDSNLQKLMCRDPVIHHNKEYQTKGLVSACVSQSSLLGRDPCGDTPIPEGDKTVTRKSTTDGEPDEKVLVHSQLQILLMEIQDKNYEYLTAHVGLILDDTINNKVTAKEMQYERNEGNVRTNAPRKRMPWKVYVDIILENLTDELELYVLMQLIGLVREDGDSVKRWLQRIQVGKTLVEAHKVQLPDKVYVLKAMQSLRSNEIKLLCKGLQQRALNPADVNTAKRSLSAPQARMELRGLKWEEMLPLTEESIDESAMPNFRQSFNLEQASNALFTLKQAWKYFQRLKHSDFKTWTKRMLLVEEEEKKCAKCVKEGLKGKDVAHFTKDCDPLRRSRKVKKLKKKKKRRTRSPELAKKRLKKKKHRREHNGRKKHNSESNNATEHECDVCKKAGRSFRHSKAKCKYAPGGD